MGFVVSSRQLSVAIIESPPQVYLFYENSNGNLTVLHIPNVMSQDSWVDITNNILDQLGNTSLTPTERLLNFGAPASLSSLNDKYHDNIPVLFVAVESMDKSVNALCLDPYREFHNWDLSKCDSVYPTHDMLAEIRKLDVKLVTIDQTGPTAIWTNSSLQTLSFYPDVFLNSPDPPFPFSKLAAISLNWSKEYAVAVYHQLTDDFLVEDLWQPADFIWVKSNITIPVS